MKNIYISLFILCLTKLSAQTPDSIRVAFYRTGGTFNYETMESCQADSFYNGLQISSSKNNWVNGDWKIYHRSHLNYNAQAKLESQFDETLSDSTWIPDVSYYYIYNASNELIEYRKNQRGQHTVKEYSNGLLLSSVDSVYQNNDLVIYGKSFYTYDANARQILSVFNNYYSGFGVPRNCISTFYDPNGTTHTDTTYDFNPLTGIRANRFLKIYMRNQLGWDTARYEYTWDNPTTSWLPGNRYVYTFDSLGRPLIVGGVTTVGNYSAPFTDGSYNIYHSLDHTSITSYYNNSGCVSNFYYDYESNDTILKMKTYISNCSGNLTTYTYDYCYFSTNRNDFEMLQEIHFCNADSFPIPVYYNPFKLYSHYLWTPASGLSSDTVPVPYVNYNNDIVYTLVVTDSLGNNFSKQITLVIDQFIKDSILINYIDTISHCQSIELTSSNFLGNWSSENDFIYGTNNSILIDTNGTYILSAHPFFGCSFADTAVINSLHNSAHPQIYQSGCSNVLKAFMPGGSNFQWYVTVDSSYTSGGTIGTFGVDSLILPSGSVNFYYFTCLDSNSCSMRSPIISYLATYYSLIEKRESCPGECDGGASVEITQFSVDYPYYITFSSGDSAEITGSSYFIDSLCTDTARFYITDGRGCRTDCAIFIPPSNPPAHTLVSAMQAAGATSCNGSLVIEPVSFPSGNQAYVCVDDTNCLWFPADSGYVFHNVCYGLHHVETFITRCSESVDVFVDSSLCGATHSALATTCISCANGEIDVQPLGTAPYTYNVDPPAGTFNGNAITNLPAGTYTICVSDASSCTFCFSETIAEDPNTIQNAETKNVSVYPNPSTGRFTIVLNQESKSSIINLFSLEGKKLFSQSIEGNTETLDFSSMTNGSYLLQVYSKGSLGIWKRVSILK